MSDARTASTAKGANGGPPDPDFDAHGVARRNPAPRVFTDGDGQPCSAIEKVRGEFRLPSELRIERFVRRGGLGAPWEVELSDGRSGVIGPRGKLRTPTELLDLLWEMTGAPLDPPSRESWRTIRAAIHEAAVVIESTLAEEDETRGWVASFAQDRVFTVDVEDREALATVLQDSTAECWRGSDRRLYLRLDALVKFVTRVLGSRTSARELSTRLGRLEFERRQIAVRIGDETVKARVWVSPEGFDAHT